MIRPLKGEDLSEIAEIHINALKGDFLPSLGKNFLKLMYQGVIETPGIYGFVNSDKGRITGFIIGAKDMDGFIKIAIKRNFLKLCGLLIVQILQNPQIIKNLLETSLYSSKETGPRPELVVIAVSKKSQGQGIGKKLVKTLEAEFQKNKIKVYKLTVYSDKKAIKFYKALNFYKIANFKLYSKDWSIFEKKIN